MRGGGGDDEKNKSLFAGEVMSCHLGSREGMKVVLASSTRTG